MRVKHLISILEKCHPSANITYLRGDGLLVDMDFVEYCKTDESVNLFDNEPLWKDDDVLITVNPKTKTTTFAETTYKDRYDG
jgi:hypothetical protein